MCDRQNPYFRAAMRNERLEAEWRESASRMEEFIAEEAAREAASPEASDPDLSSEERERLRVFMLEYLKREREAAEWHARMRREMDPYL